MIKVNWRLLSKSALACFIGAAIASLVMTSIFWLWTSAFPAPRCCEDTGESGYLLFYICISLANLIVLTLVGLPAQAFIQQRGFTGYWYHVGPAVLIGMIIPVGLLAFLSPLIPEGTFTIEASYFIFVMPYLAFFAILGFLSSSIAWLIRRPDKDVKSLP